MDNSIVSLERAEMEAIADFYRAAPPEVATACGLFVTDVAGGTVTAANRLDVLALNRIVGLGLTRAVADHQLEEVFSTFRRAGSPRYFVPIAPVDGHEALIARLETAGCRHYNNWMRLSRGLTDLPADDESGVRIRQIDLADGDVFARIVSTAFGFPPAVTPLTRAVIARPNWRHYLAYADATPIAAAAMYRSGDAAWLGFAATDAAHRRRGAQRALVVRRLRDAAADGCTWVSVETAEDLVQKDAPSFRNLRRLGFEVAYRRPNYLWVLAEGT